MQWLLVSNVSDVACPCQENSGQQLVLSLPVHNKVHQLSNLFQMGMQLQAEMGRGGVLICSKQSISDLGGEQMLQLIRVSMKPHTFAGAWLPSLPAGILELG